MKSARRHTRGFTLIASLLMLLLLSGIAIALLMMVNTEGKVGGTDLQNNIAYHVAEGGIEKMYSDLSSVFQNAQAPTASQICAVSNTPPNILGVTWNPYSVSPATGCSGALKAKWGQISSGNNKDLWAQIIPVNMLATASMPGGQEVSMTRTAQVALIPVFQFGVFCESDCAFFDTPNLDFAGRVHTNGDLYLGVYNGSTLTFHDKLEAYGNVVTEALPNGLTIGAGASDDTGKVYIPTTNGGCTPPTPPATTPGSCVLKATNSDPPASPYGDGSVQGAGGHTPATTSYNGNPNTGTWNTFSNTTTNHMLINGNYGSTLYPGTGAKKLSMPFVGGNAQPYEIIRRPASNEDAASALGTSREYNMAQIRVLLSDDPAELPGGAGDAGNVRLANVTQAMVNTYTAAGNATWSVSNPWGITITAANLGPTFAAVAGKTYNLYFAAATNGLPSGACSSGAGNCLADWPIAPAVFAGQSATQGLQPTAAPTMFNFTSGTYTAPTFTLCPTTTLPPQNYPFLPANKPALCPANAAAPYYYVSGTWNNVPYSAAAASPSPALTNYETSTWNLIDGWLRVEYKDVSGNWNPVTNEWLQLGFARGATPPTAATPNPINPNAILLLQEPADRATPSAGTYPAIYNAMSSTMSAPQCTNTQRVSGTWYCTAWTSTVTPQVALDAAGTPWEFGLTPVPAPALTSTAATQSLTQFNWYPINFYDAREGEPRDNNILGDDSCTTNGAMNAVEIDVGNLKKWLAGTIPGSGSSVDYAAQNGYVLYFSDRRGMLLNPNATSMRVANTKSGDSGLEDVVNASNAAGTPDGSLQTPILNSPEDVNLNGALDNFGAQNLGLGFWGTQGNAAGNLNAQIISTNPQPDPFGTAANTRIASCGTTGRKNWVSGARHVLKLVDGSLGRLPLSPVTTVVNGISYHGGFTVSSENPVYIQGDYNSNAGDNFWPNGTTPGVADLAGHAAAAVIADAVTLLSNAWVDQNSMLRVPTQPIGNRTAATTYYRVAVASGKNISFPFPGWANATPDYPFATDGGIGNFLRFLEDWTTPGATLNYGGSLVSLYYATYNTGLFKCCTYLVYKPPIRNYIFDDDFTLPEGLPPGTPLFKDVESLGYRQLFTTRTN